MVICFKSYQVRTAPACGGAWLMMPRWITCRRILEIFSPKKDGVNMRIQQIGKHHLDLEFINSYKDILHTRTCIYILIVIIL